VVTQKSAEIQLQTKREPMRQSIGGVRASWGVVLALVGVGQMVLLFILFRRHLAQWLSNDYLSQLNEWQSAVFAVCLAAVASSALWLLYQLLKAAERLSLPEPWVKLVLARNAGFLKTLLGLSKAPTEAATEPSGDGDLTTPADLGADETTPSDSGAEIKAEDVVPTFRLRNGLGILCYLAATPAPSLLMWWSFRGLDAVAFRVWPDPSAIRKTHVVAAMIGHVALHLASVWFAAQLLKVGERFSLPAAWVQRGIVMQPSLLRAMLGVDDPSVGIRRVAEDTEVMLKPVDAVKSVLKD
jgi:hypothetical protein